MDRLAEDIRRLVRELDGLMDDRDKLARAMVGGGPDETVKAVRDSRPWRELVRLAERAEVVG